MKASRRDLALVAARRGSAGTTVAATMYVASLAGIEIFATGGIGGVHRGAEETFDISADLVELSRTRVAVVCAGAKSILDLGKTLEFLETQGVAIVGYRTDEFPAFYARSSGFKLEHRCDGLRDLARVIRLQHDIGPGGLLIANPIPTDHALEEGAIEARIAEAVAEAKAQGVGKKEATPFLLKRVFELTDGQSLEANIALIKNNVMLAAQAAAELGSLCEGGLCWRKRKGLLMHAHFVLAHPEPQSFNANLVREGASSLQDEGWSVTISDLYAMGFDPCERPEHYRQRLDLARFDAQAEQRHASETGSLPKVVTDELCADGPRRPAGSAISDVVAPSARDDERLVRPRTGLWRCLREPETVRELGRFVGKRAMLSVTVGTSRATYEYDGRSGDIDLMLWPVNFSLAYVGYEVLDPFVAYGVEAGLRYSDAAAIETRLKASSRTFAGPCHNSRSGNRSSSTAWRNGGWTAASFRAPRSTRLSSGEKGD